MYVFKWRKQKTDETSSGGGAVVEQGLEIEEGMIEEKL
jgi:hypothetical protein